GRHVPKRSVTTVSARRRTAVNDFRNTFGTMSTGSARQGIASCLVISLMWAAVVVRQSGQSGPHAGWVGGYSPRNFRNSPRGAGMPPAWPSVPVFDLGERVAVAVVPPPGVAGFDEAAFGIETPRLRGVAQCPQVHTGEAVVPQHLQRCRHE